jgi:hypothetical protein
MHHVRNWEFLLIVNSSWCYYENCKEEIVEQIVAKHQMSEDEETEEDDMPERERGTD